MKSRYLALLLLATALPLLAACGDRDAPSPPAEEAPARSTSALGAVIERASKEVQQKLATENIDISDDNDTVKAQITPQGDLLIDGDPVDIDASQRALLLKYRGQVAGLAEAGMEIGMQGADLATKAVGEAFMGVINGNTDAMEQRIEAEAAKIEASARLLCGQLPEMLATQQELAASLPEFAPYATMTQDDIDDCMEEHDGTVEQSRRDEVREEIRRNIREGIRGSVQAVVSAEEADAAEAEAEADSAPSP